MISHGKDIKIFTGRANPQLAAEICKIIGTKLGEAEVKTFADGEVSVSLYETVRGSDVFLINPTCNPVNNSLMEQLGNAVVTAPADGTVLSVNVQVNNYASPSSSTVMLASGQSMKAVFGLPGRYFGQVQVGDTAFVQATGGTATATVTEVAPMINPQTGTFSVTAEFVNTAGLLSGSTAKVTLTTQHAEGVLTLPVDCVRFEDNKPYVYVLADGFAKKTYITLGMTDEVVYEVADGLGASDRVISTWHPNLTDGAAVAVQ
jgi:RND family efflux transporter MFP subunit